MSKGDDGERNKRIIAELVKRAENQVRLAARARRARAPRAARACRVAARSCAACARARVCARVLDSARCAR
jgi:hypothetical protein